MIEYCTVSGFSFKNSDVFFKSVPVEDAMMCMEDANDEHGTHLFKVLQGEGENLVVATFWWGTIMEFAQLLFLDPFTIYVVEGAIYE